MPKVDFSAYPYYPALQCSFPEHHGYRQLSNEDKDALLPIWELKQRDFEDPDFNGAIQDIKTSVGNRNFVLDLCKDPAPPPFVPSGKKLSASEEARIQTQAATQQSYNAALAKLLDPTDGFKAWREFVTPFPTAVPTLQFTDASSQSAAILRQGALLARSGSIAVRISPETADEIFDVIIQLISILDSAEALLIIFDCGYGRTGIADRAAFAKQGISRVLSEIDVLQRANLRAVCLSNSFPNASHDGLKPYENLDWTLWQEASEAFPFTFGDYGAIHRRKSTTMYVPGDWRATVIYPLNDKWLIYRDPNSKDQQGWITGSREVLTAAEKDKTNCWGASMVENAAKEKIEECKSPRFWYAAKVNMHLHRQIASSPDEPAAE